jgi:hypothetical protein
MPVGLFIRTTHPESPFLAFIPISLRFVKAALLIASSMMYNWSLMCEYVQLKQFEPVSRSGPIDLGSWLLLYDTTSIKTDSQC